MKVFDPEDEGSERRWCGERRAEAEAYLQREGRPQACLEATPAWHLAPYVSIWRTEGPGTPLWVITGDLPSDRIVGAADARTAMRAFATRWAELAACMAEGREHPEARIGTPEDRTGLAPLLKSRASVLQEWAEDDELWT